MDNEIKFSAESLELVNRIIARYPEGKQKSALLPVLHIAQAEFGGWLSTETMNYVAGLLKLEPIEVYEVATFYNMFNLAPVGQCVIEVCQTGPCMLNGAGEIIQHISKRLDIKPGETTPDGKFTLKTVECLAACGSAPVMRVGNRYHENLSTEKVDSLIEEWCKCGKSSHDNPYNE
ncbi:MAG: NAD(P)H-dependent oxidoreductase subunit E [Bacteroidota bacterium]|nr:NAD(P)H-dependent oxidoreductase subunit E [Bacteroidota bacterium]